MARFCMIFLGAMLLVGCDDADKKDASPEPATAKGKLVNVGDGITLEIFPTSRRVLVDAEVCLREGQLEQLVTRKNKKEHEAILAVDVDARKIHEALILAKAKEGKPVEWMPNYKAPTGTTIKISLKYKSKGKDVVVSGRSWVRQVKTRKELDSDWVFAGSSLVTNPLDGKKMYLANEGDIVTVCNFESALLDLPIKSSKDDDNRGYEAWTERIPPIGTKVTLILEPVLKK